MLSIKVTQPSSAFTLKLPRQMVAKWNYGYELEQERKFPKTYWTQKRRVFSPF